MRKLVVSLLAGALLLASQLPAPAFSKATVIVKNQTPHCAWITFYRSGLLTPTIWDTIGDRRYDPLRMPQWLRPGATFESWNWTAAGHHLKVRAEFMRGSECSGDRIFDTDTVVDTPTDGTATFRLQQTKGTTRFYIDR